MHFQITVQIAGPILFLNLLLWIINIIFTILIISYLFNKLFIKKEIKKRREEKINVANIITWFIFLLLICIANIIMLIFRFSVIDEELANSLEKISIILVYTAVFVKVVYLEFVINKWNYYKGYWFSIISLITVVFFFFINPAEFKEISPLQVITLILIAVDFSFLPFLYLFISIKTKGKNRRNAFKIAAGVTFLGLGLLFRPLNLKGYYGISDLIDTLIDYTYITAPISVLLAMILIFNSLREKKSES